MSSLETCPHLQTTDIPLTELGKKADKIQCANCNCTGPNLWMCLQNDCLRIGCSEHHNTIHNTSYPTHYIHINLTTQRIWCYMCKREVLMYPQYCESDGEGDDVKDRYQANNLMEYGLSGSDRNVGMSGDTSESSDGEDSFIAPTIRRSGLVGLQNIGNTCYLNAALQALSNTVPLTRFFLDCAHTVQIVSDGRKPGLSRTYQLLVKDMWLKKNGGYINPQGILYGIRNVYPMFRGYQQHDTQEFLRNFMDQLHEELKQIAVADANLCDMDTFSMAVDEPSAILNNYDSIESSEGEYETCDSGVSERSSLSDDTERPNNTTIPKRRLSRSLSPNRRLRAKLPNNVIENQPTSMPLTSNKKQVKYKSIISDVFDGRLLSTVQCLTCNRVSSRIETFQDLSLPIPSRDHLAVIHGRNVVPGSTCSEAVLPVDNGWISWFLTWIKSWFYGPAITLHDCLAAFFSTDELKGDNMYSCERCNKLRNGIKYSKVVQLPEVLCIHLKRFRHELMFSSKITSTVSFPLRGLDMKPYLHADCVSQVTNYELFSVICHHGTAGGGHYMCYALNSGLWYEFDDQYVTRVSADTVLTCEAYVLFYRKVACERASDKDKMRDLVSLPIDEETFYISKQWLSRFYTCAEPGPVDNRDFLCQHGHVCPDQAMHIQQLAIRVPKKVYSFLFKKYGGHPASPTAVCPTCHALLTRLELEMETLMQLNMQMREQEVPVTHLLSKSWYSNWLNFVQRKVNDPPGQIDNSRASWQRPDLNQDFAEITEDIWNFFHSIYGGGPAVRINVAEEIESNVEGMETSNSVPEFTIPKLQKRETSSHSIDRQMYCRGEPMETEENDLKSRENVEESMQANVDDAQNDVNNSNSNHLVNGNISNASATDDEVPEKITFKKSKYNRRRKRDNF